MSSEQLRAEMVSPPEGGSVILRVLVFGSDFLLSAITAWRFRQPWTPAATKDATAAGPIPWERLQTGVESAAVACLMLLLIPMSSRAHHVVLLLPSLILARHFVEQRPPWMSVLLVALLITGPLTAKGLIGKDAGDLTLAWGMPTCFVLLSLVGTWMALGAVRHPLHVSCQERPAPDLSQSV